MMFASTSSSWTNTASEEGSFISTTGYAKGPQRGERAELVAMNLDSPCSLRNYGNDEPRRSRWTAHNRVVPSRSPAHRSPDARRPTITEPFDVLADDAQCRRKPARDERGCAVARRIALVSNRRTHPQGEERCTRSALHDQCRYGRLR